MSLNNPISITAGTVEPSTTVNRSVVPVPSNIAAAAVLAAANPARKGLSLWNNSDGAVLIEYNAAPTANSYSFVLESKGYYEAPYNFTGSLQGLWQATGGAGIQVREFI